MSLLSATLRLDVRLQARHKLYFIGIVMAVLLGLLGRALCAPAYAGRVLAGFYLLGLGGTTYMFAASLVLLEKSERTLAALRTSPLTSQSYIASKVVTLTAFAVLESAIVYAVGFWGVSLQPVPLLCGLVCLGILYTLVGLGQVASHDAVTSFLFPGAVVVVMLLQMPFIFLLDVGPPLLWYLFPTQGPLLLMLGAFEPLTTWQWVYAVAVSLAAVAAAGWWARRRFARHIGLQEA